MVFIRVIKILSILLLCFLIYGMVIIGWMASGWSGRPASVFFREFLHENGVVLVLTVLTLILSIWFERRLKKQKETPRS